MSTPLQSYSTPSRYLTKDGLQKDPYPMNHPKFHTITVEDFCLGQRSQKKGQNPRHAASGPSAQRQMHGSSCWHPHLHLAMPARCCTYFLCLLAQLPAVGPEMTHQPHLELVPNMITMCWHQQALVTTHASTYKCRHHWVLEPKGIGTKKSVGTTTCM